MLTGKIFKNKLASEDYSQSTQLRQLNRIKSQPGLQNFEPRVENV